ncbi:benzoyl-CoA 2,3-epoxidase subunit A [Burkholderiales bacterium]|nr:MAG: benzoyl-CoA 2,3-epoxidase subunit BoxA [Burkholderiales bacterium]CAG0953227.1 benzoyl-CoA 2,3-epoxidase subunit A [Burkholderiales bacterium]
MNAPLPLPEVVRQHLIDPEVCIRCNTCEETCPIKAISHDTRNYVVDFGKCENCLACIPPCPTGAIDSWRNVLPATPYGLAEQFSWDALPAPGELDRRPPGAATSLPEDVAALAEVASAAELGQARPPWSAAHPYTNLYTAEHPAKATVAGNHCLTPEGASIEIRHIVLDFGHLPFPVLEGQALGIIPPGIDESGRPLHPRMYSVASPREGERPHYNNLALTVKRVTHDRDGHPVLGKASNYVCDLKKGDEVTVVGPYGNTFLMPNHPGSSLLMICTGTGSAPMRAMTERRRRRMALREGGELALFFGARSQVELPYFGPLMKLPKSFIDVNLAFSREPGLPKRYVQDLLREQGEKVWRLLNDDNCYVYLCGHKGMEEGVIKVFDELAMARGSDWKALRRELLAEGRLHLETY